MLATTVCILLDDMQVQKHVLGMFYAKRIEAPVGTSIAIIKRGAVERLTPMGSVAP